MRARGDEVLSVMGGKQLSIRVDIRPSLTAYSVIHDPEGLVVSEQARISPAPSIPSVAE